MRRRVKVGKAFRLSVDGDRCVGRNNDGSSRRLAVGEEFEAKVSLAKSRTEADATIRALIVWVVLATSVVFLLGAASLGLYQAEFSALQSVWTVVGPIYGGIAIYFFSRRERK
jgi:hypothetical protein